MILDNGIVRTLDPSLPTCGALAIAGPLSRRGCRHPRMDAADAGTREPLAAAACCPPSPTRTSTSPPGRSPAATCIWKRRTRSPRRSRSSPAHPRTAAPGFAGRVGAMPPGPRGGPPRPRRSTRSQETPRRRSGRRTTTPSGSTRPDSLGRTVSSRSRAGSSSATRRGTDRGPARGVGLALPGALRHRDRRRMGRSDPRRHPGRERARRGRDPRQGRLARGRLDLRTDPPARGPDAAGLAVAAGRPAAGDRPAAEIAHRRRLPPPRLREDVHGRHARVADRPHARRLGRPDHEP